MITNGSELRNISKEKFVDIYNCLFEEKIDKTDARLVEMASFGTALDMGDSVKDIIELCKSSYDLKEEEAIKIISKILREEYRPDLDIERKRRQKEKAKEKEINNYIDLSEERLEEINELYLKILKENLEEDKKLSGKITSTNWLNCYDYVISREVAEEEIKSFEFGVAKSLDHNYKWQDLEKLKELGVSEEEMIAAKIATLSKEKGKIFPAYRNRLMIPFRDEYGKIRNFCGRVIIPKTFTEEEKTKIFGKDIKRKQEYERYIEKNQKGNEYFRKYYFQPGNRKGDYLIGDGSELLKTKGIKRDLEGKLLKESVPIIIVEGVMDLIRLKRLQREINFECMVMALIGKDMTKPQETIIKENLAIFDNTAIYMFTDSDEAGTISKLETGKKLLRNGIKVKAIVPNRDDGKDPDEIFMNLKIEQGKNKKETYEKNIEKITKEMPMLELWELAYKRYEQQTEKQKYNPYKEIFFLEKGPLDVFFAEIDSLMEICNKEDRKKMIDFIGEKFNLSESVLKSKYNEYVENYKKTEIKKNTENYINLELKEEIKLNKINITKNNQNLKPQKIEKKKEILLLKNFIDKKIFDPKYDNLFFKKEYKNLYQKMQSDKPLTLNECSIVYNKKEINQDKIKEIYSKKILKLADNLNPKNEKDNDSLRILAYLVNNNKLDKKNIKFILKPEYKNIFNKLSSNLPVSHIEKEFIKNLKKIKDDKNSIKSIIDKSSFEL